MLKLFARYTSIGVINTPLHWIVFAICIYAFHTGQVIGNFAGFVVAVSFSFFVSANVHLSPKQQLDGAWTLSLKSKQTYDQFVCEISTNSGY
ncbi:GtrA family protein [Salmonella enterica subsp. enterica serovar Typhimurium]|nr:GtrA family protein [Salmonella enterica subsp. enterica serovar Typhimurium]